MFPHFKVDEQSNKKQKKSSIPKRRESDDNNVVAIVKSVPKLGCVSQDSEALICQRGRQSMNVKAPPQRSPYAMKFEDRSHEETERQQRCARSKAWNLAKNTCKLKEKDKLRKNGYSQPRQQKSWRKESL